MMAISLDELEELLETLSDETEPVAFSQLYGLSDLAGERLSLFRSAWPSFSPEQRRRVVRSLAELAEASFEVSFDPIFRHCLSDEDEVVREVAVNGLWENESSTLIGPLLSMLRSDPSPSVRAAAASGLGRFVLAGELEQLEPVVQTRILTELLTVLRLSEETVEVQRRALESASFACRPDVLEAIELAYYHDSELMRVSAVAGMGRSCDGSWAPIVLEELQSLSPAMRYEAAHASGELALASAVSELAHLVSDPDREVCHAAIWALGQIGGADAKQVLLDAYEEADEDIEAALDDALAEHALAVGELDSLYPGGQHQARPDEPFSIDDLEALWESEQLD